jgi:hypothetical protein
MVHTTNTTFKFYTLSFVHFQRVVNVMFQPHISAFFPHKPLTSLYVKAVSLAVLNKFLMTGEWLELFQL